VKTNHALSYIMIGLMAAILMAVPVGSSASAGLAENAAGVWFIGLGDSLTHGAMDGANNILNTENAWLQKTADALSSSLPLQFTQPFYGFREQRLRPFIIPTNLGIDGSDVFSLEGIEYFKRVGSVESYITDAYLCSSQNPREFQDDYDKVMYPINRLAGKSVSQPDAGLTLLASQAIQVMAGYLAPVIPIPD